MGTSEHGELPLFQIHGVQSLLNVLTGAAIQKVR